MQCHFFLVGGCEVGGGGGGGGGRGYLPRLKRGLGLVFGAHKQNLLLSSYLDKC